MSIRSHGRRSLISFRPTSEPTTTSPCRLNLRASIRTAAAALAALLLLGPAGRAVAESAAEKRLQVLEEELRRTQEEVQELRRQLDQQEALGQATQAAENASAASATTAKTPAL